MTSPSENRLRDEQFVAQCVAICRAGFRNEFHWQRWLDKRAKQITALPWDMQETILAAHANATHKDFSEAPKEGS